MNQRRDNPFSVLLPNTLSAVHSIRGWIAIGTAVQNEIASSLLIDDRCVGAAPKRVGHNALRAHGIRPVKLDRPERVAGASSEERRCQMAVSVEHESGDCSEPFAGGAKSIAAVQRGVSAVLLHLRVGADGECERDGYAESENPILA